MCFDKQYEALRGMLTNNLQQCWCVVSFLCGVSAVLSADTP